MNNLIKESGYYLLAEINTKELYFTITIGRGFLEQDKDRVIKMELKDRLLKMTSSDEPGKHAMRDFSESITKDNLENSDKFLQIYMEIYISQIADELEIDDNLIFYTGDFCNE